MEKIGDSCFFLHDEQGKRWEVKKVILALGSSDVLPDIESYSKLWKRRIYHCLFCLGYEDRGAESAGVLAVQALAMMPPLAVHMADNAAQLARSVTIFTNGSEEVAQQLRAMTADSPFTIETRGISKLVEREEAVEVVFQDGSSQVVAFVVHNPLTTPQGSVVQQLGLQMSPTGDIQAHAPSYQTSSRGVFAAGDCISPFKVIPHAIASGNFAAVAAATQLQAEKYGHASMV
ncbi:hypothetical protein BDV95DRAFT_609452 [Massariosphaeria phaeospora]|uniref:FAD/NAD(P)-binding domain-containing protein n=1 Tax=Massariosphaeria phaeospora TaxID=100035 RepID=A0A7C8M8Z8_9PLEO|nr:hypothetical protein BDV95DRAFT_609452 [Massariosphaeria phaeospora]